VASPPEFLPFRRVQAKTDAETKAALERAAKSIRATLAALALKPPGIGNRVRAAQLTLVLASIAKTITRLWGTDILGITMMGSKDAAKAAEEATQLLTSVAYGALDPDAAEALTRGLAATAEAGIESFFARVPKTLAASVYRNSQDTITKVHDLINVGLISGLSAKELAASVYDHISPTTPGGASYAAMRLARTEINNAFHEQQKAGGHRPGVRGVKWNLSESHPRKDLCNVYAEHPSSLGIGVWSADDVPDKPHPHCFCFLTYIMMKPTDFATALASGAFDAEIDKRTKENLAALGVPTDAPTQKKVKTADDKEAAKEKKWKGKPAPKAPTKPTVPQVDRAAFYDGWLAKTKARYEAFVPGKKLENSANWSSVQRVISDGDVNAIAFLHSAGYLDDKLVQEAKEIGGKIVLAAAKDTTYATAFKKYEANLRSFKRNHADWKAVNGITIQLTGMDAPAFDPTTDGEGKQWALKHFPEPTGKEHAAIRDYTSSSYRSWNGDLRTNASGKKPPAGRWKQKTIDADAGMKKLPFPEDAIVRRGTNFDEFVFPDGSRVRNIPPPDPLTLVGTVQVQHGYMSTSIAPDPAFSGNVRLVLRVPAGHHGSYVDPFSVNPGENEILLERSTQFYIHDAYQSSWGSWVIEAEVIPSDTSPADYAGLSPMPRTVKRAKA
jgi:hypothetical protein